jgi:hypothetical protein
MATPKSATVVGMRVFALSLLVLVLGQTTALAAPSKFAFHLGDRFGGIKSPDVSSASGGATITISASGSFSIASQKASGSGTFVHKDASGKVVARGTFTVTRRLRSFDPFGCGVAGHQKIPANFCGGFTVFAVHGVGHPASGGTVQFNAVLAVDCLLGHPPTGGKKGIRARKEGITFDIPGSIKFDKPVSGETLFVAK